MKAYQRQFVDFILQTNVLYFGEFTLKSGRKSPYFFNAGHFNSGEHLAKLGYFYAHAIKDHNLTFDVLFGPAYKGIPLAVATAIALHDLFDEQIAYSFNRKEAKDHGEIGNIIGHALAGDVIIIDDVITAGTAIYESMAIMDKNAKVKAAIVALDRKECGQNSHKSAIQEIEERCGFPVLSIITLDDIIHYLQEQGDEEQLEKVSAYRQQYGV